MSPEAVFEDFDMQDEQYQKPDQEAVKYQVEPLAAEPAEPAEPQTESHPYHVHMIRQFPRANKAGHALQDVIFAKERSPSFNFLHLFLNARDFKLA